MVNKNLLNDIAKEFNLGFVKEITDLEDGLVNNSYKIKTDRGKFVLQCLNSIFNEKVIEDYEQVQSFLRTNDIFVPVLLKRKNNQSFVLKENKIWRVFEYINNDLSLSKNPSPDEAFEAGQTLGRFHMITSYLNFKPSFELKGFHDTKDILLKLDTFIKNSQFQFKLNKVNSEINFIRNNIVNFYIDSKLKNIVIHGDPKLANFLFKNGKVIALLDLDTMMINNPLIDLGDALRSWCRVKPATSIFNKEIFDKALKGYNTNSLLKISNEVAKKAMSLLTLELSCRYLNDYFEENYFNFKSEKYKSRAEQNLTRCKRYLEYFKNFNKE
ncbi:phosphotransferase [Candidatus Pacearchaeota archaeon]|nr:phosphotransferase [Candidatus Pacearchaeota archaeon]